MNRSNASNYTSIRLLQPSRLNENQQALQMGGTKTLADYLVSIRTKKHQQHTSKRGNKMRTKYNLKPSDRSNKRRLAQEIWRNTQSQTRHPSMMNHKRNRSCLALGTITNTKRIKTSEEPARSSKQRIDEESEGRFPTSKRTGNKLQPYFTKGSSLRRMPNKEQEQHDHSVQYQFEFPADLLDDISMEEEGAVHPTKTTMNDLLSYSKSSDCCSIISQITQDSSLNDNDDDEEEESSEEENDDHDAFSSSKEAGGDEDDETQSSHSSSAYHHHIAFEMPPQDAKLAEVKEGAQLLLDLLAM